MSGFSVIETMPVVAAVASAIAAVAALVVTWRAPRAAARYTEELRRSSAKDDEQRRLKLYIFSELMKARGVQITRDSVSAMNLIDMVFAESPGVRDAWAELYSAYNNPPRHSTAPEKLNALLKVMAADIGLSNDLRSDDFERYYYPNVVAEEDYARMNSNKKLTETSFETPGQEGGDHSR